MILKASLFEKNIVCEKYEFFIWNFLSFFRQLLSVRTMFDRTTEQQRDGMREIQKLQLVFVKSFSSEFFMFFEEVKIIIFFCCKLLLSLSPSLSLNIHHKSFYFKFLHYIK